MKNIFNRKLYFEGLKKIKLVGIISGILILLGNALPPISVLASYTVNDPHHHYIITASEFAAPSLLMLVLTPFFLLSMFSFLNKRNESDFYHSIPYKRSCVLFSLLASVFTWIWGILLCSMLLTGGLWLLCPGVSFSASVIPQLLAVYMGGTLYIGGFVLLAMTLSGTVISNIAVSGLLFFLVRFIAIMFSAVLDSIVPIFDLSYSPLKLFSMRYWLPAAFVKSTYDTTIFRNVFLWVYSGIVTVGLYTLSALSYCRRKSESANKSAPSKRLQHLYRCAFATPFAVLCAASEIVREDTSLVVILALVTIAAYFLYELITAKNLRSTVRSAPLLLIPIVCALLFSGSCYLIRSAVLEDEYKPEDIQAVRPYEYASVFSMAETKYVSYEQLIAEQVAVRDEQASRIVSNALRRTIQNIDLFGHYYDSANPELRTIAEYIEITLRSGRKVGRRICFTEGEYDELMALLTDSSEYREKYLQLPETKEIGYLSVADVDCTKQIAQLWELYTEEYSRLSESEKLEVKQANGKNIFSLYGHGEKNGSRFTFRYYIPESFTKTLEYAQGLLQPSRDTVREALQKVIDGEYDDLFTGAGTVAVGGEHDAYYYRSLYCCTELSTPLLQLNRVFSVISESPAVEYQGYKEFVTKLYPYLTDKPTDSSYCQIQLDFSNGFIPEYNTYCRAIFGFKELSKAEAAELNKTLGSYQADWTATILNALECIAEGNTIIMGQPIKKLVVEISGPMLSAAFEYTTQEKWKVLQDVCRIMAACGYYDPDLTEQSYAVRIIGQEIAESYIYLDLDALSEDERELFYSHCQALSPQE